MPSVTTARLTKKKIDKALPKLLRDVFRVDELRDGQEEVIRSILAKTDTLAIMPTGAGKSLCYQVPSLLMPGTTVVVSPLISLMKDQREKMEELDIEALELNSSLPESEQNESLKQVKKGRAEIVYVTPERLADVDFLKSLKKTEIDLLVIDEAHCITQWGHDFRPSYLNIRDAIPALGRPPVLALTATATSQVIEEIKTQLGLEDLHVVYTGVMRENLFYEAFVTESETEKREKLLETLRKVEGTAIVYASTVKQTNELHDFLNEQGFDALKYHARLAGKERAANQDAFMRNEARVMVATTAFGLGIDKPDVRAVIHYNFPGTLEGYYQESGRAGRDGKPARCTLLYLKKDKSTQSFFLAGKYPQSDDVRAVCAFLRNWPADQPITMKSLGERIKGVAKTKISSILTALRNAGLVTKARDRFEVLDELTEEQIQSVIDDYRSKQENDSEKLRQMIIYAQTALCRWRAILHYFGEEGGSERCGHCDNCSHS